MNIHRAPRRVRAALAIAAMSLTGCNNPSQPEEAEPDISSVTIEHGTSTATVGPGVGTMTLVAGAANTVTVRVRNTAGADDPVIVAAADDYEIRMRQGSTVRFTQSGTAYPYTGTITTGAATGTAVYTVEVYSKEHGHVEFSGLLAITVSASGVP